MTLKNLTKEIKEVIQEGIFWIVVWKEGRSWQYFSFFPENGSYDEGFNLAYDDMEFLKQIARKDYKAICFNGYYMGLGEEDTLPQIENKILYFYINRLNQLNGDFLGSLTKEGGNI